MFKKLMPKEEDYFEEFKEMIGFIGEMADHTEKIFQLDDQEQHILNMKSLEIRCDEMTYRITNRLNRRYITPIDREDIFALVRNLDDISDLMLSAVVRVKTFHIDKKIDYSDKLASIIHKQIKEIGVAVQDLKAKPVNDLKVVKELEAEADRVYEQAIMELFEKEKDAIELMKKREILDFLERISSKCQSAANVILSIFIKNS